MCSAERKSLTCWIPHAHTELCLETGNIEVHWKNLAATSAQWSRIVWLQHALVLCVCPSYLCLFMSLELLSVCLGLYVGVKSQWSVSACLFINVCELQGHLWFSLASPVWAVGLHSAVILFLDGAAGSTLRCHCHIPDPNKDRSRQMVNGLYLYSLSSLPTTQSGFALHVTFSYPQTLIHWWQRLRWQLLSRNRIHTPIAQSSGTTLQHTDRRSRVQYSGSSNKW